MNSIHRFPLLMSLFLVACQTQDSSTNQPSTSVLPSVFSTHNIDPPQAAKHPHTLRATNGEERTDPYYWLNQRDNPEVRAYLEAENRYADSVLQPVAGLQTTLFEEMKSRIKQDDNSVPYFHKDYWYYTRYETGREYPIYCRKKDNLDAAETIMLDVNLVAEGHAYCAVTGLRVSPDNQYLAYAVDFSGRNLFKAQFKNLQTGMMLPDAFPAGDGDLEWFADNRHVAYTTRDEVTLRTDKVWRHLLGADAATDKLLYHESDEATYANLSKSKSQKFLFISCGYAQNVEWQFLDAGTPDGNFKIIKPRDKEVYYDVEHHNEHFIIRTNFKAVNFRIMRAPVNTPGQANWEAFLPDSANILLSSMEVFRDYLVLGERKGGLKQIRIIRWSDKQEHYLDFGEPTYDADVLSLPDYNTHTLRYLFSSLKTPPSTFDYAMDTQQKSLRKVMPVLGGFNAKNYQTEFILVKAHDGVMVPVSIVYKKGLQRDGQAPCYLQGYGSYGFSYDAAFNRNLLSLIDRGFVCGIAHIRGGMEMGFEWYNNGRLNHKMNSFTDFIDVSEALCHEKYTSPDRLFAGGRSAGGLLMGAIVNMRPDLFRGIIAGVPFVDVITTMSDPSIPLTTSEYTEWGNPEVPADYAYMKLYSPYDNVKKQAYPNILVLTSFADSQVQYFEPAKWVAKLRDVKTDDNLLLFKTNMSGSHGGASGRFEVLRERALEYAWMLGMVGKS
ncbi:MAG: S9 family peptidase [Saprospiraceae bacterium]|nr:S9 family peptidase [Saprospiraceae bacterium]